jgi:hypothetical protein
LQFAKAGRQRRGAVAAGEEQNGKLEAGKSTYYQLYVNSGK